MRGSARIATALALALLVPAAGRAQQGDGPVVRARRVRADAQLKVFYDAGSVRFVGWDKDSLVIRGRVRAGQFYLGGDSSSLKFGVEDHNGGTAVTSADLTVYLPRGARVAARTVSASISARDVSGWFYTVSGDIALAGTATSLDALSMSGAIELSAVTPWVRARTGDGRLVVAGAPEDVDASTITGPLVIATSSVKRGQLATVRGDIRYTASPARGAVLDMSTHSGAIELNLPRTASARMTLSSIEGHIEAGGVTSMPTAAGNRPMTFDVGDGASRVTARTYKGVIRVVAR
ncbi:MAG TPA: DUF4097 family beta strand repeat-containing protein [Gemmatimonadaceae bacterium]|nr:DUF4097 family beta strand repeat-containing protein [Gemmatimonadaceae bacterium]